VKKILWSVLAFAVVLGTAICARAQDNAPELKPVAVISFSGYAELKRDLEYLGETSGNPDMFKQLEGLLTFFTQGQGLAGLDQDKPWGAAAALPEGGIGAPNVLVFLPVTDVQKLLGALAQLTGEPVDKGDGILEIKKDANSVYVKEQDGWAYVAQMPDALANLPADPLKLLGGLNEQYDLALRLNIQNVPQALRDFAVDAMKQQVERSLQQAQENSEEGEDAGLQPQIARHQVEMLGKAINELDGITLGWSIDSEDKRALIDLNLTALEGSDTAKQLASVSNSASKFAGFLMPEALLTAHINSVAQEADIEQSTAMLAQLRTHIMDSIDEDEDLPDEEAKDLVKELVDEALDVAEATVKNGRFNGGLTVVGEGPLTIVAGGTVADGEKLEDVAKKLVKLAQEDENSPEFELDVDEHKGVKFHTAKIPLPEDDEDAEKARQLFGDEALLTVGFGPDAFYVALGDAGLETIKAVMDKSAEGASKELPPLEISLALAPLLNLAAQQENSNPSLAMVAESLKEGGADHLKITVRPIENGVQYEIEGEEGIIKLIGSGAKLAQAAGGAGGL
jgi:hypothetical protein